MIKNLPCAMSVEEKTSRKTRNTYKQLVLIVKGKEVPVGIVNVYMENALLRAGIDINSD